jgi:hypothetical protein
MEFIKDIHEARMTRNSSDQRDLTYSDCCEKMFLILCIIEVMRHDQDNTLFLQNYLRKTTAPDGYRNFRMTSTDLYNFVYFVNGDNDAMDKLKNPGEAKQVRRRTHVSVMAINRYLITVKGNPTDKNIQSFNFFYEIQNTIKEQTSTYSSLRRDVGNFVKLSIRDKKEVITKLLHAAQAKLRASDIIDYYATWAGSNKLIDPTVKDTEIDISQPDLEKSPSDVSYYRLIVGNENAVRATKFVEYAAQGKATPINFIQSYLPIIQMVHDFVKAGPVAISQLKLLHKRIKKLNKK